jgi:hypothetical protein
MSEPENFPSRQSPHYLANRLFLTMNLNPYFALVKASEASQEFPPLTITRPNSPSSEASANATYTDLTPLHNLVPIPSIKRHLADVLEPMSMYGATSGIIDMWNRLLQDHAKEPGDRISATDYTIIEAVSPYYILRPTSTSAWFITEPGLAGRNNPSGESRLTTGIALCLEDRTVTSRTHGTEFHVYYCRLGIPISREGGYTFYSTKEDFFSQRYFPCAATPISTIVAVPDYHTREEGRYLSVQPNTFGQRMIPGYSNLALPPLRTWEKEEEKEEDTLKPMVGFDWYLSQEEAIKRAGEGGM